MIKKFYVDVKELDNYSRFLTKSINDINVRIDKVSRANNKYQSAIKDDIATAVDIRIKKMKRLFTNFELDVNELNKKIKEDYQTYLLYLKKIH